MSDAYDKFEKCDANFVALSPISFLKRAATVFADDEAVVYGEKRYNWAEVYSRVRSVASGLASRGLGRNDTICVLAPNIPEVFELHYAIPMAGAVINAINTRLEAETIAYILAHSESKLVFCDVELKGVLEAAFEINGTSLDVIWLGESDDYETLVDEGDPAFEFKLPNDEWDALALNYTSGTSGRPKGVVYHHRGAYLMSLSTVAAWSVPQRPVFLSVSPMFHCNGWNHPWAMAIVGAKMVFTRNPMPELIFKAIEDEDVTHFGAAPVVLSMLAESEHAPKIAYEPRLNVMTAGAPPPPSILERFSALGMDVMQVYGLTETYGHIAHCLPKPEWDNLTNEDRAAKQAMQGVAFPMTEDFVVLDRYTRKAVPHDGESIGEIAIRGNTVMKGYFKNPEATDESFEGGYFLSGDAAVVHPDSYVQVRDRYKDVIISGGENISSVEVEAALYKHPSVLAAAVVAMPSVKWGESPCAFIELREGETANEAEIISFCKQHLAGFKVPKAVHFDELPKTATGKIQKFILRDRAKNLTST